MPEIVHTYLKSENKCPNCRFYNSPQNVLRHIHSSKNKNGEICKKKYQEQYSKWYYLRFL